MKTLRCILGFHSSVIKCVRVSLRDRIEDIIRYKQCTTCGSKFGIKRTQRIAELQGKEFDQVIFDELVNELAFKPSKCA